MKRALAILASVLVLSGCALQPTGISDGTDAPTGIAAGPTLYFVDADGALKTDTRHTDRLGSISDALALLLTGPTTSGLETGIAESDNTRVQVTVVDDIVEIRLPLAQDEVTPIGVDQIVCTATASEVQRGGSPKTEVRLLFTIAEPGAEMARKCPLLR